MITVDKGVPLPPPKRPGRPPWKYPFATMKDGDSFAEDPDPVVGARKHIQRLVTAGNEWAKRNKQPMRFTAREVEEKGRKKIRCWATAVATSP